MTGRGPRKMQRLAAVVEHWDAEHGRCLRCGRSARCERAHLIDRSQDGLDGVQNLVPLCFPCHHEQPVFFAGQEARALAWLATSDQFEWSMRLAERTLEQFPQFAALVRSEEMPVDVFVDLTWRHVDFPRHERTAS